MPCSPRSAPPRTSRADGPYDRSRSGLASPLLQTGAVLSTYLDELLAGASRRVADARARESMQTLRHRAREVPVGTSFRDALRGPGVAVIAEIKRASPSAGDLAPDLSAPALARAYVDGGAAAVSVLTEPDRFKGSLADLADVAAIGVPALRKDFLVDTYQIWEARLAGASAVLLIVAALDEPTLALLHDEARTAGLDVLVEVHDEAEMAAAHRIGADLVGINTRDLRTFELDPNVFARLRPQLPDGALAVLESGIRGPEDVSRAAEQGADAVLVGGSLVTAEDPAAAVAALVEAGQDLDVVPWTSTLRPEPDPTPFSPPGEDAAPNRTAPPENAPPTES